MSQSTRARKGLYLGMGEINGRQIPVYAEPQVRWSDGTTASGAAYMDGCLRFKQSLSCRRLVNIAAGFVCWQWRAAIVKEKDMEWNCSDTIRVGRRSFGLVLKRRPLPGGFFIDFEQGQILLTHQSGPEMIKATIAAVDSVWRWWRDHVLKQALVGAECPAAERLSDEEVARWAADFDEAARKLGGE